MNDRVGKTAYCPRCRKRVEYRVHIADSVGVEGCLFFLTFGLWPISSEWRSRKKLFCRACEGPVEDETGG